MSEKEPQYINSITRALRVLELYGELNVQYLGVAEVSKELNLQKTTAFNILKTLAHGGWLVQDVDNRKYKLSTRILQVSTMVTRNITTEDLILQEMHRLRDLYNEDVVLTAMVDGVPICVEKVQSTNVLRIESKVGRVSNLVRGSTGKALFAWQSEEFISKTLEQMFGSKPDGAQKKEEIRRELEKIRQQGYCITVSEQNEGVASVSVPIRNRQGYAIYSLAVLGEEKRIKQKDMDEIRKEVVETARRLEEERGLFSD